MDASLGNRLRLSGCCVMLAAMFVVAAAAVVPVKAYATVYFVDAARADDAGDGQSWAAAEKTLAAGIADATAANDEIWVKSGAYTGGITVPAGVKLYGGFAGTETDKIQRNFVLNETIINTGAPVVTLATGGNSMIIDGFTIQGGSAATGGGISATNVSANSIIANCKIQNNTATAVNPSWGLGGGIYLSDSSVQIVGCTFLNNQATMTGGALAGPAGSAIYGVGWSSPAITGCLFQGNQVLAGSGETGGALAFSSPGASYSSSAIIKCTFIENSSVCYGGAVWLLGSSSSQPNLVFKYCVFDGNSAASGAGAVRSNNAVSSFVDCEFRGNTASANGAGAIGSMGSIGSATTVTRGIFENNSATGSTASIGGAIRQEAGSTLTLTDVTFKNNSVSGTAPYGGAIHTTGTSTATFSATRCVFDGNQAGMGGAIFSSGTPTELNLTGCTFTNNATTQGTGGAVQFYGTSATDKVTATLQNCMFWNNQAYTSGAALCSNDFNVVDIQNCSFAKNISKTGNVAGDYTVYYGLTSTGAITNSILYLNATSTPPGTVTPIGVGTGAVTVTYSDVQNSIYPGIGNVNADPLFVDVANGDLHLRDTLSPCIDQGLVLDMPTTDLEGRPRGVDIPGVGSTTYDMGAYEFPVRVYVSTDGDDAHSGLTWALRKKTIAAAIALTPALPSIEIWVVKGTYPERISLNSNVQLYGGFVGTESARAQRNIAGNPTIIDGGAGGTVVTIGTFDLITPTPVYNSVLDGFTVQNGRATGIWTGAGIDCNDTTMVASPGDNKTNITNIIANCTVTGNTQTTDWGGGLLCGHGASPRIMDCTFSNNTAGAWGGGALPVYASPTFTRCVFSGNTVTGSLSGGGGVMVSGSAAQFIACRFSGNTAPSPNCGGGAVFGYVSLATWTNCVFYNNNTAGANNRGGAFLTCYASFDSLVNCTFQNNSADGIGNDLHSKYCALNNQLGGHSPTTHCPGSVTPSWPRITG